MSEKLLNTEKGGRLTPEEIEANFKDLHPVLSNQQAEAESSRCLYCYDAPCIKACPTSIDIPQFIHQIGTGNVQGAAETILSSNIFGGTCSRVCPVEELCQGACVKKHSCEEPVAIGHLQRFAVDHYMDTNKPHPFTREKSSGKKAAVIGAGPAGLACAHRLAVKGHDVVVFDAKEKSGGLNEYGLAAYKMTDNFARKEVEFILQIGGITIENGKTLGKDFTIEDLRRDYDALFIATGLGDVNQLNLPGEDLPQVRNAIDFIEEIRQASDLYALNIPDDVIVIGGGNTAIDAAVQAKRLGARRVTMVYRRGSMQMPATEWEQNLAKTNDVPIRYWATPLGIETSKDPGKVLVRFKATAEDSTDKDNFSLSASLVLKAIGQKFDTGPFSVLDLEKGKIKVDDSFSTSLPGVYAGGDCVHSGSDLTVQAVDDGARAAESIHQYLTGGHNG